MINIQNPKNCCGCGACIAICPKSCIKMQENAEGFLYPIVDISSCIGCGLCNKICPWENGASVADRLPAPDVYAAWNLDEEIRKQSSSGGVFSVLAEQILSEGGIVVGAAYVDNCKKVEHIIVDRSGTEQNRTEQKWSLNSLRGSKYVQSEFKSKIYHLIEEFLKAHRKVLFSGAPCQVAGIRNYLREDYPNLYVCDTACMGVPSPGFFRKYIEYLQEKECSTLDSLSFRNKRKGWSNPTVHYQFKNGINRYYSSSSDILYSVFSRRLDLRYSCFDCKYKGTSRLGDITIADFWGVRRNYPQLDSENKGISLLLVNTSKGRKLLETCRKGLFLEEADLNLAIKSNPRIVSSAPEPKERKSFLTDSNELSINQLRDKYKIYPPTLWKRIRRKIIINLAKYIKG